MGFLGVARLVVHLVGMRVSDRHKGARRLLKKWIVRVKWLLAHLFAQKAKLELVLFVHFISKNCGFQLVDFIKKALA